MEPPTKLELSIEQGGCDYQWLASDYLGGSTENHQILGIKAEQVLFKYRDHRTHKMVRSRYAIADFERQILRHLPIPNQQMIRYYGFYHPSQLVRLNQARQALGQADYKMPSLPDWQAMMDKYGLSIDCVICAELSSTSLTSSMEELKASQQD